jgi:hypothetical protein
MNEKEELIKEIAKEIAITKAKIDSCKDLYNKLDELTMALHELTSDEILIPDKYVLVYNEKAISVNPQYVKVIDNFYNRNVTFKTTPVKRFEISTETLTERAAKALMVDLKR